MALLAVEIASSAGVIALGVFLLTFLIVVFVAWKLAKSVRGEPGTSWRVEMRRGMPARPVPPVRTIPPRDPEIDQEPSGADDAGERHPLDEARDVLAGVYRFGLIGAGLAGVALAVTLFRQADSANMLGLPAAIILLLAVGALLSGATAGHKRRGRRPFRIDTPADVRVNVSRQDAVIELGAAQMTKAAGLLARGVAVEDVARAIYPQYDSLSRAEQQLVEDALAKFGARG